MKPTGYSYTVAAMAFALCLIGGRMPSAHAQDTPPPAAEKIVTEIAPEKADLTILAKAMQALGNAGSFLYEGDIEIKGDGKGMTFTGRERVRFSAKRPGKVRSDIMISLGDAPTGKRYVTVSDGENVYVQRPGTRQYSMSTFDATAFTKDLTGLGILGALYFNSNLLSGIGMITPENADQFVNLLKKEDIDLSGTIETVDGVEMPVYTLALTRQNRMFRFFVDPKRAVLRRLEVTAHEKNMNFTMTETVVRQNAAPAIPKGEFKFVPPPGHRKTEPITIEIL